MTKLVVGVVFLLGAAPSVEAARVAPAPNCLDARQVVEVSQANETTIAVAAADGQRYQLDLGSACNGVTASSHSRMLAKQGWMCGAGNEFVASGDQLCPVDDVSRISSERYAELARASYLGADGAVTLSTVEVKGKRQRGFAASSNYCLNPKHVRGWSEDGDGIIVEVDPRRSGGNRFYRVELVGTCPQISGGSAMQMRSGIGIGVVCGNPGDTILTGTRASVTGPLSPGYLPLSIENGRPADFMIAGSDRAQIMGAKFGCPIRAFYPRESR